jgi:hypothetical protein
MFLFLFTRAAQQDHNLQDLTGRLLSEIPLVVDVDGPQGWHFFARGSFSKVCRVTITGVLAPEALAILKVPNSDAEVLVSLIYFIQPVQHELAAG